jgi:hypothetical protein
MKIKYLDKDVSKNIIITIKKNIKTNSLYGKFILYNLGYNIDNYEKVILKCRNSIKSFIFNKKINNILLIIVNYNGSLIIYKYNIYKNIYTYDSTFIQND